MVNFKNITIFISALISIFLWQSCKKEQNTKVVYHQPVDSIASNHQKIDNNQIEMADLPINFNGTTYLLYPLGKAKVNNKGNKYDSDASYAGRMVYSISNYIEPEITGNINNVLFQHIDSLNFKPLTQRKMLISSITYLDEIAFVTSKKYLLYLVNDLDTNNDKHIDTNDVKSLYLSAIDGSQFVKISKDLEEVLDWKVIRNSKKLYFRAIEDSNKNGLFDAEDQMKYYFIDFSKDDWSVEQYAPKI